MLSKQPIAAYGDSTFAHEAHEVFSRTFVAHIRFASTGALETRNTHPVSYTHLDVYKRQVMALGVILTAGWSYVLLERTPHWQPWLAPLVLTSAAVCAVVLMAIPVLGRLRAKALARCV